MAVERDFSELGEGAKAGFGLTNLSGVNRADDGGCETQCCSCSRDAAGDYTIVEDAYENGKTGEAVDTCSAGTPNNEQFCTDFAIPTGCHESFVSLRSVLTILGMQGAALSRGISWTRNSVE